MRSVGLTVIIALSLAGGASAEVVARGVHDGMVAVAPGGTPLVAYMRGASLDLATRAGARWHTARVRTVAPGSTLVAFASGAAGPVALVRDTDERTLLLLQRRAGAWRGAQLVGRLPVGTTIGWPGLTLDRRGLPVVAYTRWRRSTHRSALILARVDSRGRVRSERITAEGFPKSHVAPPAAPVVVRGRVHVIETYGFDGAVGTIDWTRQKRTWEGQFIDAGIGDFPVGPMFAATGRHGTVYAAWSQVLFAISGMPVSLAMRGRSISSDVLLDRAVTTGLAVPAAGPEISADEWISADEVGLPGDAVAWAGELAGHGRKTELDGWLADVAAGPAGGRDLLLARPGVGGLSWFRSPRSPSIHVSISAAAGGGGAVVVSGRVRGAGRGGKVTVYRERLGPSRQAVGTVAITADGAYSLVDHPPLRPLLYRAVYTAPSTGIPYAALLRDPVR
jgi:hypothetical protein